MNSEVASAQSSPNFSTPTPMSQGQTMAIKKKSGMMPILIGIAGLFFVAVYTLFWTKIFNFKLPFLP
jgi:cell division septal protein FtsQ